ncbi:hypothetical protein KJ359_003030 [Pestalotiopsis sp. 9143b]|nr:hypothetical protein KJ359_003030 [Pestalotiopsis sp. 9143b]
MPRRLEDELTSVNDVLNVVLKPGDGLEEQNSTERTLLLQLVLLSKRPLRFEEACAAIGRAPADNEASERYITNLSKGLVEAKEHQDGDMFVHFIHNMVNDYLLSEKRLQILSPELGDDPIEASHGRLWACCLERVQTLIKPSMTEQEMRALDLSHPFLSYAANYTLYHAEMAWGSMTYRKQIEVWLKKQRPWFTWMKKYRNIEQQLNLLRVVILDGLPNLTRVLLVQNVDSMPYDEKRDTLQALSFSGGSTDMLKILLDHGAKIIDQGGDHGDALQAGLRGGDEKVVRFLLENGAKVENRFHLRKNVLDTAMRLRNPEIIDIPLEFGARSATRRYVTVLQAAAAADGDKEAAASLLINRGADVNALSDYHGSPIQIAALEGNKRIIQLLIDEGADINAPGGVYGNALEFATAFGDAEIIKLLIDLGADINSEGGRYGGALQAAAFSGDTTIMALLLSHDANIEADGGDFGNALYAASSGGQLAMVEFLLERGANPNADVGYYGNPLQAAAASHIANLDVVKLLVARGCDVNAEGGGYGNALCAALAFSRFSVAKYLLENGARTNLRGSFNRTALHYAVETSSVEMVQELLNRGASPEEVDDAGASPLDVAVQKQYSDMIHPLLRHASSMPTLSANDWRDCLGWASSSYLEFCTSEPLCIKQHGRGLFRYPLDQLWRVILLDDVSPRGKIGTLITSMSTAKV